MAYIVSVRARYCQILRFKARSNDGPGFGRRSSILNERLCPLGACLTLLLSSCVNYAEQMRCKHDLLLGLTDIVKLDRPVRVRIFVRADSARKKF
jgi:hypothetical protein